MFLWEQTVLSSSEGGWQRAKGLLLLLGSSCSEAPVLLRNSVTLCASQLTAI